MLRAFLVSLPFDSQQASQSRLGPLLRTLDYSLWRAAKVDLQPRRRIGARVSDEDLEDMGSQLMPTAAITPQQNGGCDRHGGVWRTTRMTIDRRVQRQVYCRPRTA